MLLYKMLHKKSIAKLARIRLLILIIFRCSWASNYTRYMQLLHLIFNVKFIRGCRGKGTCSLCRLLCADVFHKRFVKLSIWGKKQMRAKELYMCA